MLDRGVETEETTDDTGTETDEEICLVDAVGSTINSALSAYYRNSSSWKDYS